MDKYGRDEIETAMITELEEKNIQRTIIFCANQMLRTIALCYRDFEKWPPAGIDPGDEEVPYSDLVQDMALIGIMGIENPLRPGVRDAVAQCLKAGVAVKMCTGDNVLTARSIATQCGIYTAGGIIMEGPAFRRLNERELQAIFPRLPVESRTAWVSGAAYLILVGSCTLIPRRQKKLVSALKTRGEIVGVTCWGWFKCTLATQGSTCRVLHGNHRDGRRQRSLDIIWVNDERQLPVNR